MKSASAFTSSLRHAAVVKSGSSSTVAPVSPRSSAIVSAASPSGSTSRTPVRSRTQPSWCGSAENHTLAGTTVDDGHSGPTRSICSTPFCSTHTTVRSSHSRLNHPAASRFCVSLTASRTTSTGSSTSAGSVITGPGTTIGSLSSGLTSTWLRGVCPHNSTWCPAACRNAAMVEPMAPGPMTAIDVPTNAKLPAM